eukprot:364503-Chlamydomonas_euryale.AAC.12
MTRVLCRGRCEGGLWREHRWQQDDCGQAARMQLSMHHSIKMTAQAAAMSAKLAGNNSAKTAGGGGDDTGPAFVAHGTAMQPLLHAMPAAT